MRAAGHLATLGRMSSTPPAGNDWVTTVVGLIERGVGLVRDRTTRPAVKIARFLVWGLLAAILGLVALVLLVIMADRLVILLTGHRVYLAHMGIGIILLVLGLIAMRKRHVSEEK
jgi:hypothetical protein